MMGAPLVGRTFCEWGLGRLTFRQSSFYMKAPDIIAAHRHSIRHRDELLASAECGCFYCEAIFPPSEIREWCDTDAGVGQTALCPRCGIDSVIGSASGYPITREFLDEMREHWF